MIKHYLLAALRSFRKNKAYSLLTIMGLTLGVFCALVIFLFVHDELTYDSMHQGNIFRLNAAYHLPKNGGFEQYAASGPVVGEMIAKDFPEVDQVVRFRKIENAIVEKPGTYDREYETIVAADSNVFRVFNFSFIEGDPQTALLEPMSLVISKSVAEKYFKRTDVVGESLRLPDDSILFKITGVMENPPSNTHLRFNMIFSFETLKRMHYHLDSWWNYSFHTYLALKPDINSKALEEKIKFISRKYIPDQEDYSDYKQEYSLTPLSNIHLYSNLRTELESNSKASYVYTFLVIGVFILLIACINYMNLATAKAAMRAKEIGLRKVAGAFRTQLVGQFLGESFLMTLLAVLLSVTLVFITLPVINNFLGRELTLIANPSFWLGIILVTLMASILAGSYPSLFLSAFKPVEVLKGNFRTSSRGNLLRRSLVVFQFAISIFLISGTLIVYNQLTYLQEIHLGFDKERIVVIPTRFVANAERDFKLLKEELKKAGSVFSATLSSCVPGKEMGNNVVRLGWSEDAKWSDMRFLGVDHDFVEFYDLNIMEGRDFDESFPSDEKEAFMLNESGMRRLGWNNPKEAVGQKLKWQDRTGFVIGVVKDFHFMSANVAIEPFIMVMNKPWSVGYLSLKIGPGKLDESIRQVKNLFEATLPDKIFEYSFLDEDFDKQYKSEERFMTIFTFFACVAIAIACLGLYGLAMFIAEIRFKEIGIRKVLGATSSAIAVLMSGDFIKLVALAFLIATPFAFWVMNQWLGTFPYKEEINLMTFLISGLAAIAIAVLTVASQSVKAAKANPIDSIRNP
jgi:putative ABC transport system permease protein